MSEDAIIESRADSLIVHRSAGDTLTLPYLWLRDNCSCEECVVVQTTEKKFLLSSVPANIRPDSAECRIDTLKVSWPGGHRSRYDLNKISSHDEYSDQRHWCRWEPDFIPATFDWQRALTDDDFAVASLDRFLKDGAVILDNAPRTPGSVEMLEPLLGPIRTMPFGRIHDVKVDPDGYNVAHTALELPPHNDFASKDYPPSIQVLHMLENEAPGGESIILDGFALAEDLRAEQPEFFQALCEVPIPFCMFSDEIRTYCVEPLIRTRANGEIAHVRFSNQLMQMTNPSGPGVASFYRAYHELCSRIAADTYRRLFRLAGGQALLVAGHRVMHARVAFEPVGMRHLQDAYFDLDNAANILARIEHSRREST